jgi:hypothetical protein
VFVIVLGVARRAARLLHVRPNHRDDGVVRQPALARTVIIQNVTKPKLALLHQLTPDGSSLAGNELRKGGCNLSRAALRVATSLSHEPL